MKPIIGFVLIQASIALGACIIAVSMGGARAAVQASGDYPVPQRLFVTPCDTEPHMAADGTNPVDFERSIIDPNNGPADIQQMAQDRTGPRAGARSMLLVSQGSVGRCTAGLSASILENFRVLSQLNPGTAKVSG